MVWTHVCGHAARARRDESGAGSAAYGGVIVVVVILVAALAAGMTPVGDHVATGVDNEICKIFGVSCDGDVQAEPAGADAEPQPAGGHDDPQA